MRAGRVKPSLSSLLLVTNCLVAVLVGVLTSVLNPETCSTLSLVDQPVNRTGDMATYEQCAASFDTAESFLLGLLVFVSLTVVELSLVSQQLFTLRQREDAITRVEDKASMHVSNIAMYARAVAASAYSENDRYLNFFLEELAHLEERLRLAAEDKQLVVPVDEFQRPQDIDGAFQRDSIRVFSHTWPVAENEPLFTSTGWKYFFELLIKMLNEGTVERVRSMLIVESANVAEHDQLDHLLEFYAATPGLEGIVVARQDFAPIATRNGISPGTVDFGVYDQSLLYVAEGVSGKFTKDPYRIAAHLRLFDSLWDSAGLALDDSKSRSGSAAPTLRTLMHRVATPELHQAPNSTESGI
jgi:hypothetical protein